VLNWIWLFLILISIGYAALTGRMEDVSLALFEGADQGVKIILGFIGTMAFMLGVMQVAFDGGLRDWIARWLSPLLRRLFPDVPADHPAMSAIVMNMASNILGMGNAATPFGIKAMTELSKLNRNPEVASNSMVLFLAINTSAITLMPPSGTMAVRMAAGSTDPDAIWIPTLIATTCSTLAAVTAYYVLGRLPMFRAPAPAPPSTASDAEDEPADVGDDTALPSLAAPEPERAPIGPVEWWRWAIVAAFGGVLLFATVKQVAAAPPDEGVLFSVLEILMSWGYLVLVAGLLLIGVVRKVAVYDSMITGGREALDVAVRIVPNLVAILAAVAMLRASGFLDMVIGAIDPLTRAVGVPAEVLPMAILRPLSGSGAFGVMSETLSAHGADSFIGMLASTLQGSTETTFYVLAVYYGAARITQGRHTLPACLSGDLAGFIGAVVACHLFFG
jgi:spore maturation protein SpmA